MVIRILARYTCNVTFKDHFSDQSNLYNTYRPNYPDELFAWLAACTTGNDLAWDCATGTGQAAHQLAPYYAKIIATDGSEQQISNAEPGDNISYAVACETYPELKDHSVDLVTVAQAIHWFDTGKFFNEVSRVLKPGGAVAIWGYNLLSITPEIDVVINNFYWNTLRGYWPPERKILEDQYASIEIPLDEIGPPSFEMLKQWNLEQLVGYLATWSAVKNYRQTQHSDPIPGLLDQLSHLWANNDHMTITWPLTIRVATIS